MKTILPILLNSKMKIINAVELKNSGITIKNFGFKFYALCKNEAEESKVNKMQHGI